MYFHWFPELGLGVSDLFSKTSLAFVLLQKDQSVEHPVAVCRLLPRPKRHKSSWRNWFITWWQILKRPGETATIAAMLNHFTALQFDKGPSCIMDMLYCISYIIQPIKYLTYFTKSSKWWYLVTIQFHNFSCGFAPCFSYRFLRIFKILVLFYDNNCYTTLKYQNIWSCG